MALWLSKRLMPWLDPASRYYPRLQSFAYATCKTFQAMMLEQEKQEDSLTKAGLN